MNKEKDPWRTASWEDSLHLAIEGMEQEKAVPEMGQNWDML